MYDEERPYEEVTYDLAPEQRHANWEMASGLQAVDGLRVSRYAEDTARRYIEGDITAAEATHQVQSKYDEEKASGICVRQAEADIVAMRINEVLEESSGGTFRLEPKTLTLLHGRLFKGQLEDRRWVGRWREVGVTKAEPVLGGRSVGYLPPGEIVDALDYDFTIEKRHRYKRPLDHDDLHRVVRFIAGIWQIHPFREGNTRTTALFSQLYLNALGCHVDNALFRGNSLFFRDALVRASYSSLQDGIEEDYSFIDAFYENLAMGACHNLADMDLNLHGIRVESVEELPYRTKEDYELRCEANGRAELAPSASVVKNQADKASGADSNRLETGDRRSGTHQ